MCKYVSFCFKKRIKLSASKSSPVIPFFGVGKDRVCCCIPAAFTVTRTITVSRALVAFLVAMVDALIVNRNTVGTIRPMILAGINPTVFTFINGHLLPLFGMDLKGRL